MHVQERCNTDGEMSEDFLTIAKNCKYLVQCSTTIGWVTVENPEYRNGNSYRVIREEEVN